MRKVMIFGAFDGLHPGHLDFFKQSKKYGDYLIVSVGTDKNVKKFKGRTPLFSQKERMELVKAVYLVDETVLGAEENFWQHIKDFSPDVVCLGYDQWARQAEVRRNIANIGLLKTKVIRLKPYKIKRAKSTIVKTHAVDF